MHERHSRLTVGLDVDSTTVKEEVADHALALTLALVRHLKPLMQDVFNGNWNWRVAQRCKRIRDQILGIVGCGRIGTAMALRSKALGFRVIFCDPYAPVGYDKAIAVDRVSSLEELLRVSDIVSIHAPLRKRRRSIRSRAVPADEKNRVSREYGPRRHSGRQRFTISAQGTVDCRCSA
jgi:phosphoglycerate dehydrogenase-like enzyme